MKTRFSDEQIIQMIKEQEAGEKTADVCRRFLAGTPIRTSWRCLEMSMATSTVAAVEWLTVIAGLLSGVVLQNHC